MRIGVIGGSGFLGTNILRHLVQNPKYQLHATARKQITNKINSSITWSQLDLNDRSGLLVFLKEVDTVIYLAHTGGPNVAKTWDEENEQNLVPLENFLETLRQLKRPTPLKVIYFSTGGALYGKSPNHVPWKEDDLPKPISTYGALKKMAEDHFRIAAEQGLCKCICLRVSNPYGNYFEHSKQQGIIDVAVSKIKSDSRFVLYGSREFVRDMIHMDDLNCAVELCLNHESSFEVLNIGSGIGTSIGKILDLVQDAFSKKLDIEVIPTPAGTSPVDWVVLDVSKAKSLLGWSPKINIQDGIRSLAK